MSRKENISNALAELLLELSEIAIEPTDFSTSFLELGFDSLLLTQVSSALKKEMGVNIRFRKLLEDISSIELLTKFCEEQLPADAYTAEPAASEPPAAAPDQGQAQAPAAPQQMPQQPQYQQPQYQQPQMPQQPQYQQPQMPQMPQMGGYNPMQMQMYYQQMYQQWMAQYQQQMMMYYGMQGMQMPMQPQYQQPQPQMGQPAAAPEPKVVEKIVEIDRKRPDAPVKKENDTVNKVNFGPYKPIKKGEKGALTTEQQAYLDSFMQKLLAKTPTSKKIAQENRAVQADPRTVAGFRTIWKEIVYQIVTERSKGSKVWDVDGNEYVDITMGFGINFLGHSPDFVTDAVRAQLDKGVDIGPQSRLAGMAAHKFTQLTGLDRVSFCNTGSEAVMAAVRMARTITGRDKIVYFNGDYHGVFDEVLARPQTLKGKLHTVPATPGITEDSVANVWILDYGTQASVDFIKENLDQIAGVLVETVQSRHPENRPHDFIKALREITQDDDCALILDEVITGFRVHPKGMQHIYGVKPDIACYGKIIGGGMPIGAVAGDKKYMDAIDGGWWEYGNKSIPEVDLTFFAGTFVRHPLAMAAANAVLDYVVAEGPELQERVNTATADFAHEMNAWLEDTGVPIKINHYSSWFRVEMPSSYAYPDLLFYHLLLKGVYIFSFAQNCFFSIDHTAEDIAHVAQAMKEAVTEMQAGGFLPKREESKFAPFPLTEAQKEVWYASQISDTANCAYNETFSIRLTGKLNQRALQRSVERVIRRHKALHLRFSSMGDTQHLAQDQLIKTTLIDLSDQSATEQAKTLSEMKEAHMRTPFDLENGPMVRPELVKLSETDHILFWYAHHIVYDGWSQATVIDEIRKIYNAETAGLQLELIEPGDFKAYAAWEKEALAAPEAKEVLDYWGNEFKTMPPLLDLPSDFPRPAAKSYQGSAVFYEFDADLIEQVRKLAQGYKASLFAVMYAGFKALMYRLSGQEDLVMGIFTAGQSVSGHVDTVGYAVNLLPVRTNPAGELPFNRYVDQVKTKLLDVQEQQPFTFGQLLQTLKVPRDPSRSPLVEVVFNLDRKVPEEEFVGLTQELREVPKRAMNWDLFLNMYEEEGTLKTDTVFNTDLYSEQTVIHWLDLYQNLLRSLVETPNQTIDGINLIAKKEVDLQLVEWNKTTVDYPKNKSLVELISETAAANGDKVAIIDGERSMTYREMDEISNQIGHYLRQKGIKPGDLIGVSIDRSAEMVLAVLGVMKSGGAYIPLDPNFPNERLAYIIEDSDMPLILTESSIIKQLPEISIEMIQIDQKWESITNMPSTPLDNIPSGEAPIYMIYTSGSTGNPKGVKIPQRAAVNFLNSMGKEPGLDADDVLVSVTTLSFDIAVLELYLPLLKGGTLVVTSAQVATDANLLAQLLDDVNATIMQATPATWQMLVDIDWSGRPDMKMLCGGEPMPRHLADKLDEIGGELWNMYGPTETTVWSSIARVKKGEPITIGRPIDNTQMYVLNSNLDLVPVGVQGELWIGGDGVALGYHNRPDLNAERFIDNPFGSGKIYKTGDLARYNSDGTLVCLGRVDFQVKIRGFRIELGDIEAQLNKHEAVQQAVVHVQKDRLGNPALVGYMVPVGNGAQSMSPSDWRTYLNQHLPKYMVPSQYILLNEFPLTPNGKINRLVLPNPFETMSAEEEAAAFTAPRDEVETALAGIWQESLKVDKISVTDDFFDLGGHSLIAVTMLNKCRNYFGLDIPMADLFEFSSVESLGQRIKTLQYLSGGTSAPIVAESIESEEEEEMEEFEF